MTEQEYKEMSIKEFIKALEIYDSGHTGLKVKKPDMKKGFRIMKYFPMFLLLILIRNLQRNWLDMQQKFFRILLEEPIIW